MFLYDSFARVELLNSKTAQPSLCYRLNFLFLFFFFKYNRMSSLTWQVMSIFQWNVRVHEGSCEEEWTLP